MTAQLGLIFPEHGPAFYPTAVTEAIQTLASVSEAGERGAIFTLPEVVEFILDAAGYVIERPLHQRRLLEPSFGGGDFLLTAARRLIQSYRQHMTGKASLRDLGDCLRAVELHESTFSSTRIALLKLLAQLDVPATTATWLVSQWLRQGDFLLEQLEGSFDFVVGNPPYVRQELIPAALLLEYRSRYTTIYDRADLYIPFIERSLQLLKPGGHLAFICADRWMKNRYGGPLRALVADGFHLKAHIDMVDVPAFFQEVSAYPAIFVVQRSVPGPLKIAHRPPMQPQKLKELSAWLRDEGPVPSAVDAREVANIVRGSDPWLLEAPGRMALLRRLEDHLPTLEEAGCMVGIGVATGADAVFIAPFESLDVEADRKLPLAMTRDIQSGEVRWNGLGVINPFTDEGGLVDLNLYPRLAKHLETHRAQIEGRHCAKKSPKNWFRTIDRITPSLASRPKLLIPDIKGEAHVVFEEGKLYPHHNLYFVTSKDWELRALQAVLLSSVAHLFVASYATKMRGGYLRFQAQYLRRIRVPYWHEVSLPLRRRLTIAAKTLDRNACDAAAAELYGLSDSEIAMLASEA